MPLIFHLHGQLFRRVAAALPGMDSTENKPPEDSILYLLAHFFSLLNFEKRKILFASALFIATMSAEPMANQVLLLMQVILSHGMCSII